MRGENKGGGETTLANRFSKSFFCAVVKEINIPLRNGEYNRSRKYQSTVEKKVKRDVSDVRMGKRGEQRSRK